MNESINALIKTDERHDYPDVPVFTGLKRAKHSYGGEEAALLFDLSFDRYFATKTAQIHCLVGPPGVGKTTLASELIALAEEQMDSHMSQSAIRFIKYIPFEDAQKIAAASGAKRDDDDNSDVTKRHYVAANRILENKVREEVNRGSFIVLESPGLVGRGDTVVEDIAQGNGVMREAKFDPSFYFITAGAIDNAKRVRKDKLDDPGRFADALEEAGTTVHIEEEILTLGGGDIIAVERFYGTLAKHLYEVAQNEEFRGNPYAEFAAGPEDFLSSDTRALFLERVYSKWLYGEKLNVDPKSLFVGRNLVNDRRHLYHDLLSNHNVFARPK